MRFLLLNDVMSVHVRLCLIIVISGGSQILSTYEQGATIDKSIFTSATTKRQILCH